MFSIKLKEIKTLKTNVMEQFKKCQVVMLPTNEKALIHFGTPKNNLRYTRLYKDSIHHKYQHLYITSDDEIKEGDWYVTNNKLFKADDKFDDGNNPNQHKSNKLVIATTDSSLCINNYSNINRIEDFEHEFPQPSQSFIEKYVEEYNKGNVITDILVEYEFYYTSCLLPSEQYRAERLKVNPKDNTITIKKVKDSWNRDEVIKLMNRSIDMGWNYCKNNKPVNNRDSFDKWIEENL